MSIGLDENSRVLLFSTEGDTDPERYKNIVWKGLTINTGYTAVITCCPAGNINHNNILTNQNGGNKHYESGLRKNQRSSTEL